MSTLWTPEGERSVGQPPLRSEAPASTGPLAPGGGDQPPAVDDKEMAEQVEAMQKELANAPVEVVVANHCYGLFELAAVYLSQTPPLLAQTRLAIDALACLVDGLKGRLGESEEHLKDGLSQLRLAYVQIDGAHRAGEQMAENAGTNGATTDGAPGATDAGAGATT